MLGGRRGAGGAGAGLMTRASDGGEREQRERRPERRSGDAEHRKVSWCGLVIWGRHKLCFTVCTMLHSYVKTELRLFSYEILGLVGRDGAAPHDLLRMARRGRMLEWAGESQYYVEPKRLARLGYLEARKEPGQHARAHRYTLTDKGLDALREYARTPVTSLRVKSEPCCGCWSPTSSARRPRARACHAARRHRRPARAARREREAPDASPTAPSTCCSSRLHAPAFDLHLDLVERSSASSTRPAAGDQPSRRMRRMTGRGACAAASRIAASSSSRATSSPASTTTT